MTNLAIGIMEQEPGLRNRDREIMEKESFDIYYGIFGRTTGASGKALGAHPGSFWRNIWETSGTHLVSIWDPSGQHLDPRKLSEAPRSSRRSGTRNCSPSVLKCKSYFLECKLDDMCLRLGVTKYVQ
jgi:hypothetical protein